MRRFGRRAERHKLASARAHRMSVSVFHPPHDTQPLPTVTFRTRSYSPCTFGTVRTLSFLPLRLRPLLLIVFPCVNICVSSFPLIAPHLTTAPFSSLSARSAERPLPGAPFDYLHPPSPPSRSLILFSSTVLSPNRLQLVCFCCVSPPLHFPPFTSRPVFLTCRCDCKPKSTTIPSSTLAHFQSTSLPYNIETK